MNTNYYLITKDSNIHTHNLEEDIKAFEDALKNLSNFKLTIFKKRLIEEFGENTYLYDSITKYQIVFYFKNKENSEKVKDSEYYKEQIKKFCENYKIQKFLKKLGFETNEIDILLEYKTKREKLDDLDKLCNEVKKEEYNTNYLVKQYFEDNKDFEDIYNKFSQDLRFHYIQNSYGEGYGSEGIGTEYNIDNLKKQHTWLYDSLENNSNYALSMPVSCIHDFNFNMNSAYEKWSNIINRDNESEGINKELYTRYDSSLSYKQNEEKNKPILFKYSGLESFDFEKTYKKEYNFYEIKKYKTKLKLKSGYEYYEELKKFERNNHEHYSYFEPEYGHDINAGDNWLQNDNGYFSNITGTDERTKSLYVRPNRTDKIKYEFKPPLPNTKRPDDAMQYKDFAKFKIYKEGDLLELYPSFNNSFGYHFKYSNKERNELARELFNITDSKKTVYNNLIRKLSNSNPRNSIISSTPYSREGDTYKDAIRNMETLINRDNFKNKTDLVKKHFKEFYFDTSNHFDKNDYLFGIHSDNNFNFKFCCLYLIQYICTSSVYSNFKNKLFEYCNLVDDNEEFEKIFNLVKQNTVGIFYEKLKTFLNSKSYFRIHEKKYKEILKKLKKLLDVSKKKILTNSNNLDINNLDMNNIIIFYLKKSIEEIKDFYEDKSTTAEFKTMKQKFENNKLTYDVLKNYDKQTGGNINKNYLNLESNENDEEQSGGNVNTNYLNLENDMTNNVTTEMTGGIIFNRVRKINLGRDFYNTMDKDQFETLKENQYIVKITNEDDWLQLNNKDVFIEKNNAKKIHLSKINILDNNLLYESNLFKKTTHKDIDIWKIETLESNDKLINETDKFNLGNINITQFLDLIEMTLNSKDKNKNDKVNYLFYFIKCYGITPLIRKEVFDGILEKQSSDFKLDIFLNNKSNNITNFSVLIPYLQFEILKIINENNFFNISIDQYKHLNFQSIFFDYNIIEEDRLNLKSFKTFKRFVKKLIKNS